MKKVVSRGCIECPLDKIDKFVKPMLENGYEVKIFFDGMNCGIDFCFSDRSMGDNLFMLVSPEEAEFLIEAREHELDEDEDEEKPIDLDKIVDEVIRLEEIFRKGLITIPEYEGHLARIKRGV